MNVYRPFNPQNDQTQKDFFDTQLALIQNNVTENTIILGDFNLDQLKAHDLTYSHKNYFEALNVCLNHLNLIQMVTFETWSRTINNVVCSSVIDHIYIKDPTKIGTIYPISPPFGDHLLIIIETSIKKSPKADLLRRNWKNYTPAQLNEIIQDTDWNIEFDIVQAYWNKFECKLID